jgi:hypothetical protein
MPTLGLLDELTVAETGVLDLADRRVRMADGRITVT